MSQTILAIYPTHKKAAKASILLGEKGYYNSLVNNDSIMTSDVTNIASGGSSGAFWGTAIGVIVGYIIAVMSNFNPEFGSYLGTVFGLPGFIGTIVLTGIIGAIGGALLGSFIIFGISEDIAMDASYNQNSRKAVAIYTSQNPRTNLIKILKQTSATNINLLNSEYAYQPLVIGSKGGRVKKPIKKRNSLLYTRTKTSKHIQ